MVELSNICTPCQGGIPPLDKAQAQEFLKQTPDWSLSGDATRISAHFEFKNFVKALEFVNQVGDIAEKLNHHPNITFSWGFVDIEIYTHKINGLHENDFVLAKHIQDARV